MEKKITFTLKGPNGSIIGEDPIQLLYAVFGCEKGGAFILEENKQELFGELEEHEVYEYKIIVEKRYTDDDLEKMGESDGDIH